MVELASILPVTTPARQEAKTMLQNIIFHFSVPVKTALLQFTALREFFKLSELILFFLQLLKFFLTSMLALSLHFFFAWKLICSISKLFC